MFLCAASSNVRPSARFLDEARAIVLDRLAGHAAQVYLFSSWATRDARRISDIESWIWLTSPRAFGHASFRRGSGGPLEGTARFRREGIDDA